MFRIDIDYNKAAPLGNAGELGNADDFPEVQKLIGDARAISSLFDHLIYIYLCGSGGDDERMKQAYEYAQEKCRIMIPGIDLSELRTAYDFQDYHDTTQKCSDNLKRMVDITMSGALNIGGLFDENNEELMNWLPTYFRYLYCPKHTFENEPNFEFASKVVSENVKALSFDKSLHTLVFKDGDINIPLVSVHQLSGWKVRDTVFDAYKSDCIYMGPM